jgi:sulfur relay (sulfurtransferase) DsrC/TusE family protein
MLKQLVSTQSRNTKECQSKTEHLKSVYKLIRELCNTNNLCPTNQYTVKHVETKTEHLKSVYTLIKLKHQMDNLPFLKERVQGNHQLL